MDCQMPNLDGYQATNLIREMEKQKGGHLKIIAMTANAMNGDREKCLRAGMDDYISKPIKGEKLIDVIGKYIELEENLERKVAEKLDENIIVFDSPVDLNHLNIFTEGNKEEEQELTKLFFEQARFILQSLAEVNGV
jgi:DNA-binding response OmpR family regulator